MSAFEISCDKEYYQNVITVFCISCSFTIVNTGVLLGELLSKHSDPVLPKL